MNNSSRRNLLSPDFGSSKFSVRAANPDSPPTTGGKKVKFARQLTDEYKIASRHEKTPMPVSMEELANRLVRAKQTLKREKRAVKKLANLEDLLLIENDVLFARCAPQVQRMQYNTSIAALKTKVEKLNEQISDMRMETLRFKGRRHRLVKQAEMHRTKLCSSFTVLPLVRANMNLLETLWTSRHSLVSECA